MYCFSQNGIVGDGFGGRLWYKPYNFGVGSYSAFSICPDSNQLYFWGSNSFGQYGNGSNISSTLPIKVNGLNNIKYCAMGYNTAVIKNDKSGWVFGLTFGKNPIKVIDNAKFVNATTSTCHFIKEDGTVWSVGQNNATGAFGNGDTTIKFYITPQKMYGINTAVRVAHSSFITIILLNDGTVMTTGLNFRGGNANDTFQIPRKIQNVKDIIDVKAIASSTLLLDKNGDVYQQIAGDSFYKKLSALKNIIAISGCNDGNSYLALDKDSNCYAWGKNAGGELGIGSTKNTNIPQLVETDVEDIMMGEHFAYIIKSDGTLWACGSSTSSGSIWLNLADIQRFYFTKVDNNCAIKKEAVEIKKEFILCQGDSIILNGNIYKNEGLYSDTIGSINGDTILHLTIKVLKKSILNQNINLCINDSIIIGLHVYKNKGIYLDTLINYFGCDSVITTNLSINICGLKLYNVFTPNNDGINDVFEITAEESVVYDMIIYNRWGILVFETKNAKAKDYEKYWNGKIMNTGVACNSGVYYYIFRLKSDIKHPFSGVIELLK